MGLRSDGNVKNLPQMLFLSF